MATGNFYYKNTSAIFAIGSNHYTTQEEIDENGWDQELLGTFDEEQTRANYEDSIDYCQELLKGKKWDTMNDYDRTSNRNYPASIIGDKTIWRTFAGVTLEITMKAKVVSGYYEGACFDLEASMNVYDHDDEQIYDFDDFDEIQDINGNDIASENWNGNKGLSKIFGKAIAKVKDDIFNQLRDEAENAFRQASEYRLGCLGHGSNGEAFYYDMDKQKEDKAA